MSKLWKDFRVNLMYWRFRHITRNRLRFQSWWATRRRGRSGPAGYRPRGSAVSSPYLTSRVSRQRSWIALLVMVALLTALKAYAAYTFVAPGLAYAIGTLIVVGSVYWALRGT